MPRILSGIQSSGALHIGNYFGMMRPAIRFQDAGEAFYFIADYHALTSVRSPETLRANSQRVAIDLLACGLDPNRATLFRQSDVPSVTELAWILSTVWPMGLLERAHSYKDKLSRGLTPSVGLFTYPVLMAADILIYDSDLVPVSKDQKQHVEMTRDVATKMNDAFGNIFKVPEARLIKNDTSDIPYGFSVPGRPHVVESPFEPGKFIDVEGFPGGTEVRDPHTGKIFLVPAGAVSDASHAITPQVAQTFTRGKYAYLEGFPEDTVLKEPLVPGIDGQKMSKSYRNTIDIFGDEKEMRKRVMSIVTDSQPVEAPKDPTGSTIVHLFSLFASKDEIAEMRERFKKGGTGYGDFKKQLFEKLWEYFSPMRKRREELLADKLYVDEVLVRGARRANEVAEEVMTRVRAAVGLR